MAISDRIVVMNEGKAIQVGPPREVYRRPASRFVASFVGVVNLWPGTLAGEPGEGGLRTVTTDLGEVKVTAANVPPECTDAGSQVVLMARPEMLSIAAKRPPDQPGLDVWEGTLRAEMFRGAHTDLFVEVGPHVVRVQADDEGGLHVGQAVFVSLPASRVRVLPATERTGPSIDDRATVAAIESALTRPGSESAAAADPPTA